MPQTLFSEQLGHHAGIGDFVSSAFLHSCFQRKPDPILEEMGGTRVELALAVDRTVYQLEVKVPQETGKPLQAFWLKTDTHRRKVVDSSTEPVALSKIPVTWAGALQSLTDVFGLNPEVVRKKGVNLLAFWESTHAGDALELPMSADCQKFAIAS